MKFSKYISKAVTPVMALFQKQHSCLSNKATTICGYSVCSLRQVPVRHNRGGKSTENKVRFAPPTMCRLTSWDNPVTAFFRKSKKLRHSLVRPSRSDFVQLHFYELFVFLVSFANLNLSISSYLSYSLFSVLSD